MNQMLSPILKAKEFAIKYKYYAIAQAKQCMFFSVGRKREYWEDVVLNLNKIK